MNDTRLPISCAWAALVMAMPGAMMPAAPLDHGVYLLGSLRLE